MKYSAGALPDGCAPVRVIFIVLLLVGGEAFGPWAATVLMVAINAIPPVPADMRLHVIIVRSPASGHWQWPPLTDRSLPGAALLLARLEDTLATVMAENAFGQPA